MKLIKIGLAAAGLLLLPTAAYAVNVSSNDGSGSVGVNYWLSNDRGASMTGNLRSTHGSPVYFAGKVVQDDAPDDEVGRYTSNTSSTSGASRGGIIQGTVPNIEGVAARVCRDRAGAPDPCGSYSSTIRK